MFTATFHYFDNFMSTLDVNERKSKTINLKDTSALGAINEAFEIFMRRFIADKDARATMFIRDKQTDRVVYSLTGEGDVFTIVRDAPCFYKLVQDWAIAQGAFADLLD